MGVTIRRLQDLGQDEVLNEESQDEGIEVI